MVCKVKQTLEKETKKKLLLFVEREFEGSKILMSKNEHNLCDIKTMHF